MPSSPTALLSRRPLMEVFAQVPDPRDPRGVRHDLPTVLTLAQTAVLAGSRTLLAIAEWTQDAARDTLSRIGIDPDRALPSESTIRRTLAQVDANELDSLMAGWMATRVGELAGRRVIALDGKTMRGARTPAGAPHLVAAFDHTAGAVVGQVAVTTKSNEIPALRDLLAGMDITDTVVTADAMHCQRETAEHITGRGGHYVLTVKDNQPTLRAACKALPWKDVPALTVTDRNHGRRVRRTIKAVQAPDWISFPGAAQIVQLHRTRTIKGRRTTEVVYAICSLDMIAASPATVATWIQGHWSIENSLHWVRSPGVDRTVA
jgi:predicted transposase YbfD/YdcC